MVILLPGRGLILPWQTQETPDYFVRCLQQQGKDVYQSKIFHIALEYSPPGLTRSGGALGGAIPRSTGSGSPNPPPSP